MDQNQISGLLWNTRRALLGEDVEGRIGALRSLEDKARSLSVSTDKRNQDVAARLLGLVAWFVRRRKRLPRYTSKAHDMVSEDVSEAMRILGASSGYCNVQHRLAHSSLVGLSSTGLSLVGVDLMGVDLTDAELINADLRRANLREAGCFVCDMSGADLRHVNLQDTDLTGTNLTGNGPAGRSSVEDISHWEYRDRSRPEWS